MIHEILHTNLRRLRTINAAQSPTGKKVDRALLMENFLMATYDLGLMLSNEPCLKESLDFIEYIEDSIFLLEPYKRRISDFIQNTEFILNYTFQGNEWKKVCTSRSAIEFLKEFYQDTGFATKAWCTCALDEKIRRVGEIEGYLSHEEIPVGMPSPHWWWWYPTLPPHPRNATKRPDYQNLKGVFSVFAARKPVDQRTDRTDFEVLAF
ncbi:MAG: hypothetical protein ACPGWR_23090 [Ardenticatenaceae bacterium]